MALGILNFPKKTARHPVNVLEFCFVMVICWHRAKIEIFLETLEKLPSPSQVLG